MNPPFMPYPISDVRLPFWTQCTKETECNICERTIKVGERVYTYPAVQGTWCSVCGPRVVPVELEES